MKTPDASTLSEHLMQEASRFLLYPQRVYRTKTNLGAQRILDDLRRRLVDWRKTFAPRPKQEGDDILTSPVLLDELYCRDLLREISGMVQRTRALSELTLADIKESEPFVYLREAANCYIMGLPQATVALARATTEARLRDVCSKLFGEKEVRAAEFVEVIDRFAARGLLNRQGQDLAHKVREAGNDVLHQKPTDLDAARVTFEAARAVILKVRSR